MYKKIKELGWKENRGIQNVGNEDSKSNITEDQRQVLRIWENYVTELYDQPNWQLKLEVQPEEEVHTDEKGSYIVQNEMEKAINEVRNKKATGDNNEPGHVIKLGRRWSQTNDKTGQHYIYIYIYETGLSEFISGCFTFQSTNFNNTSPSSDTCHLLRNWAV